MLYAWVSLYPTMGAVNASLSHPKSGQCSFELPTSCPVSEGYVHTVPVKIKWQDWSWLKLYCNQDVLITRFFILSSTEARSSGLNINSKCFQIFFCCCAVLGTCLERLEKEMESTDSATFCTNCVLSEDNQQSNQLANKKLAIKKINKRIWQSKQSFPAVCTRLT